MSWLNYIVPFLSGFCREYVNGEDRMNQRQGGGHEQVERILAPQHYDFKAHMWTLAKAVGGIVHIDGDEAIFALSIKGESYTVEAKLIGSNVFFAIISRVEFPLEAIPAEVMRAVNRLKGNLPQCAIEAVNEENCSVLCIPGSSDAATLTPQMFIQGLAERAVPLLQLDNWIIANGLAPRTQHGGFAPDDRRLGWNG